MASNILVFEDFEFPLDRPVNYYLLETGGYRVLVDTGTSQGLSRPGAPRADLVIITHYHLDHSGGLIAIAQWDDKPLVCASEDTSRILYDLSLMEERMAVIADAMGFRGLIEEANRLFEGMRRRYEAISKAAQELGLEPPERCLGRLGGSYLECPGHSDDHICVIIAGRAFVGDNIVGGPNVTLRDMYRYFESMYRFLAVETYNAVHPGHGPHELNRSGAAEAVVETMKSKRKRLAAVLTAIAGSGGWVGLDRVFRSVYRNLPNLMVAWVAARSLLGYLTGLEADGVVEVDRSSSPWRVRVRL
ncbi:MAG: MBL fold metallo-hydrolase [Desulfurococcales archaeon]|nr:MBL fold metallo-hydrolase [Desulfurococcales archaeon]